MKRQKIGIALSGGVDSTSAAILLQEKYEVEGFFMKLAQPELEQQIVQVTTVAEKLGIKLHLVDLKEQFDKQVLDYFSSSYFQAITPNPCVICNKKIKFGLFLDIILQSGMEKAASGHYARIVPSENNKNQYHLLTGVDSKKDQSYFLSRLSQRELAKLIFPLGDMTKDQIYALAEARGFTGFRGKESQDICFLENKQLGNFLENRIDPKDKRGDGLILSTSGQRLGTHKGLYHYTIGQRKGLGISSTAPLYVVQLDKERNAVIVGSSEALEKNIIVVNNVHWISGTKPSLDKSYTIRIRYSHRGAAAKIYELKGNTAELHFNEPQRAITPGQFAAIYDDEELLGSGVIV